MFSNESCHLNNNEVGSIKFGEFMEEFLIFVLQNRLRIGMKSANGCDIDFQTSTHFLNDYSSVTTNKKELNSTFVQRM